MPASITEYIPQLVRDEEYARRSRAAWFAWGASLSVAATLVGLIVAAPILRASGDVSAARTIYVGFSAACHQIAARSFYLDGFPLAVCARCFGLYVGALAGVAAYPLARPLMRTDAPERVWLILAALPTTVDFALGFFGIWENTHWSRFLTALLLGVVAAFYVVPGLVDLGLMRLRRASQAATAS
jgi:uncharacterized membrane protein